MCRTKEKGVLQMGVDKTNGLGKNFYLPNNETQKHFKANLNYDDLIQNALKKGEKEKKEENIPIPYSREAWNAMSDEEKAAILAKKDSIPGFTIERQTTQYVAATTQSAETATEENVDKATANTEEEAATETSAQEENESTPAQPGSPDRYKGENKPATNVNWSELNGNYFEAIDEPDENGKIPTRPIHGKVTIEGEVKEGENPKKITITDQDNGREYVFELDESIEDKVVYRCTQGPSGAYTKGNEYELRTINGVPMLVQMHDFEGHGVAIGKTKAAPAPAETDAVDETEGAQGAEGTQGTETPETTEETDKAEAPKGASKPAATPEERKAQIEADAKSLEPDLTPKKHIDKNVEAQAKKIVAAVNVAPQKAKSLIDALSHDWVGASDVKKELNNLSPTELVAVLNECIKNDKNFDIAKLIDNVFNLDRHDVYDLVVTKLQERMKELGINEITFNDGSKISRDTTSLKSMGSWIRTALLQINNKERAFLEAYGNQKIAVDKEAADIKQLKQAKPIIDAANKTLAEAANANPPLKVQKDTDGDEYVQLPDGRFIFTIRDNNGNIEIVSIGKGTKPQYADSDVCYTNATIDVDTDKSNYDWEISTNNPIDFNKILELAKRIFGENTKDKG